MKVRLRYKERSAEVTVVKNMNTGQMTLSGTSYISQLVETLESHATML